MANPALPENMPVGYRFHPTEEELVDHYLKRKLDGDHSVNQIIAEVDVSEVEPWDLPRFSKVKSDDPEWFFFTRRCFKYKNSDRSNRTTKVGYWKATGRDRTIKAKGTDNILGTKKTLVFHRGRSPSGVKTNWVIHEYNATTFPDSERTYVLCHLMEKIVEKAEEGNDAMNNDEGEPSRHMEKTTEKAEGNDAMNNDRGEPSRHMASGSENQASSDRIPSLNSLPEVNFNSIFEARDDFPSIQPEPSVNCSSVPTADDENEDSITKYLVGDEEDNADDVRSPDEE